MNEIDQSKKVKRITAIIYVLFMLFLMIGTFYSEQRKEQMRDAQQQSEQDVEIISPSAGID